MLHTEEQRAEMLAVVKATHATVTLVTTKDDFGAAFDAFMDVRSRLRAGVGLTGLSN